VIKPLESTVYRLCEQHAHIRGEATTADPDLFRGIGFTQALEREERQQLLRNTDASRASTKE
jgi:hypothetical protein